MAFKIDEIVIVKKTKSRARVKTISMDMVGILYLDGYQYYDLVREDELESESGSDSDYWWLPKKKVCTCGAKHTSFPNHHLDWCDLKKDR